MKKKFIIFITVFIFVLSFQTVFAADEEKVKDIYDFIPDKTIHIIEESGINLDIEDINIDFSQGVKIVINIIKEVFKEDLKFFSVAAVLCIIYVIFSSLKDNITFENTENIFSLVIASCILVSAVPILTSCITDAVEALSDMSLFIGNSVPVYTTLMISSGDVGKSAVVTGGLLLITDFFVKCFSDFLAPLTSIFIALSISEIIFKNNIISGISSFMKKSVMFFFGIIITFFTGIFSIKNIISLSSDTLAKKAIRFSLSGFIPVGGSMISESIDTFFSSADFLKSTVGVISIICVVITLLMPVLALLSKIIVFRLSQLFSDMMGSSNISCFFKIVCDGLFTVLSILICTGFMTVFTLAIMVKGSS